MLAWIQANSLRARALGFALAFGLALALSQTLFSMGPGLVAVMLAASAFLKWKNGVIRGWVPYFALLALTAYGWKTWSVSGCFLPRAPEGSDLCGELGRSFAVWLSVFAVTYPFFRWMDQVERLKTRQVQTP